MMMTKPDPKEKVTLESLLQLKRAERPPEEFWAQFESELRAKQLAAIVDRRPWWSPLERMSLGLVRHSAPVGAAAALAVALLGFHEYRVHAISATVPASPLSVPETAVPTVAEAAPVTAVAAQPAPEVAAEPAPVQVAAAAPVPVKSTSADINVDPFSGAAVTPRQSVQVVSLRSPAFDRLQAPAALVSNASFTPGRAGAASAAVLSVPVDPLTRITAPADDRRSVYLSDSLPAFAGASDDAAAAPTRVASRLSDERLYEQIRRLGVGGDRLQFRF